jgi:hypothetical protein
MVVGRQTQNGREYPYYHCGRVTADCADQQHITAPLTEETVVAYVKKALAGLTGRANGASGVAEVKAELERTQVAYDNLVATLDGLTDDPSVREKLLELRVTRDEAKQRYDEALEADDSLSVAVSTGDWDDLTLDEQRDLIRAVIKRVVIHPGRGAERIEIQPK